MVKNIVAFMSYNSATVNLDAQSRMKVDHDLMKWAQLSKNVIVAGAFDRFEIWRPTLFEEHRQMLQEAYVPQSPEQTAEDILDEMGIDQKKLVRDILTKL